MVGLCFFTKKRNFRICLYANYPVMNKKRISLLLLFILPFVLMVSCWPPCDCGPNTPIDVSPQKIELQVWNTSGLEINKCQGRLTEMRLV